MANYNGKVTASVFEAVKICLKSGNSCAETAKFMKLSKDVVYMIRDSENLGEYKAMMASKYTKRQMAAIKAKEAKKEAQKEAQQKADETKAEEQAKKPDDEAPEQAKAGTPMNVVSFVDKTYQMNRILEEQKKTNELLALISNKLAFIVEQLS